MIFFPTDIAGQLFDYLIIIDFESTCWKDGRRCQEISKSSLNNFNSCFRMNWGGGAKRRLEHCSHKCS